MRWRVIELVHGPCAGCNDHHLAELLATREGIVLSRKRVERLRREAGLKATRQRQPPAHRRRRDGLPQEGMLLSTTPHPWRRDNPDFLKSRSLTESLSS